MPRFEAYIAMPADSAPDLRSLLESDNGSLRPLTDLTMRTHEDIFAPYHDWITLTGSLPLEDNTRGTDTDDDAAFAIARLLAGHISIIVPGAEIHRVAVGHDGRCTPPTILKYSGRDTVNKPAIRPLVLLATSKASTSAITDVGLIGLGDQEKSDALKPIFPLVIETPDVTQEMKEVFESYEELADWADETFDEWTIAAV